MAWAAAGQFVGRKSGQSRQFVEICALGLVSLSVLMEQDAFGLQHRDRDFRAFEQALEAGLCRCDHRTPSPSVPAT
ncbi:hypothetical protein [Micromonospora costi]|uniref:hypothetical protein n=1 Tax=Micromonospora costi TaxID=1530042 RepID=UPI0011C477E4|nr:hypothetical protein [Micromonospora costi]